MKLIYSWWVVLVLAVQPLCGEQPVKSSIPVTDIDAGASAMVAGCVNAITGDFVYASQDLLVVGPEPLLFERFYVSSDHEACSFFKGWRHNHHSEISYAFDFSTEYRSDIFFSATWAEPSGRRGFYAIKCPEKKVELKVPLHWESSGKGLTNSGAGILSGRTNPKNNRLRFSYKGSENYFTEVDSILAQDGAGIRSHYQKQHKEDKDLSLSRVEKLDGHCLRYQYGRYDDEMRVKKVQLTDKTGQQVYSWIKIVHQPYKALRKQGYFEVSASDGRKLRYKIAPACPIDKDRPDPESTQVGFRVEQVESNHAPTESYQYAERYCALLSCKSRPDNRFLAIEYYTRSDLQDKHNKHEKYRIDRVKFLKAPVGPDATPHITHRFVYYANTKANFMSDPDVLNGQTHVFNIHNHKVVYGYDAQHRLDVIERYTGNGLYQHYSSDYFSWGADGSADAGNLLSKRLTSGGQTLLGQTYTYDKYGNVTKEVLYGNLSGTGSKLNWEGTYPQENGAERYIKSYRYSDDKFNLLLESSEENGLGTLYGYHPGSDLLAYKLVTMHGAITIRHFYEYDENGVVTKTIVDNGNSRDCNDFSQVTERRITLLQNRKTAPFGVPELVEERYLDLSTGYEKLLQRTRNTYALTGELLKREVHDSTGTLRYAQSWSYDPHGNLLAEIDALGHLIERTYDANDNMLTEKGPGSILKRFFYDFSNRLVRTEEEDLTDGTTHVTTHTYDGLHNRIATRDFCGQETRCNYDELGRCTKVSYPAIPNLAGQLITTELHHRYDPLGNVVSSIDQCAQETRFTSTIRGKPASIHYPDGTHESFLYNLDGTLQRATAKNGMTTTYTYDCLGRITIKEEQAADGTYSRISSTYNAFHMTSSTDAMGRTTFFQYDGAGRLIEMRCDQQRTTYGYDELGRLHTQCEWYSEEAYRKTVRSYDLLNHLTQEEVYDSQQSVPLRVVSYTYDADGNMTSEMRGDACTRTEYNGRKQPVRKIDAQGAMILMRYAQVRDSYGVTVLETTVVDSLGNQTITLFNALGKAGTVTRKNAVGQLTAQREHFYTGNGDLQEAIDTVISPVAASKKILTCWRYDAMHHLIELIEATGTPDQQSSTMRYNSAGQRDAMVKPDGTEVRYSYDGKGRLQAFLAPNLDYLYTYDAADHPIRITDRLTGQSTIRQYAAGQLIAEQLATGHTVAYSYDRLNRPLTVTFPDQSGVRYTYDALELKQVERLVNGSTAYVHQYLTYDLQGRLLTQQLLGKAGTLAFGYDLTGRPLTATHAQLAETVSYDAAGNLIHGELKSPVHAQQIDYTYDDLYQLKSESGEHPHTYLNDSLYNCVRKDKENRTFNNRHQMLSAAGEQYQYDRNGNLLSRSNARYTYDALDRLITLERGTSRALYTYDALNRRLATRLQERRGENWVDLSTTTYLYQGQDEVGSLQDNQFISLRLLGVGKGAEIGATIALELKGKPYAPLHDHNGNIVALIDPAGQLVESYRYSAFGEEQILDGQGHELAQTALGNPWRFSSKRTDAESGLVYFGRRYYDPSLCRWLTPDPLGFDAGPNLFAYVQNSPLTHIDLYGLAERDASRVGRSRQPNHSGYYPEGSSRRSFAKAPPGSGNGIVGDYGWAIGALAYHFVPIPGIRDVGIRLGNFLEGNGFSWRPLHEEAHSRALDPVGKGQLASNVNIVNANGMLNTKNDATATADGMSIAFGDIAVAMHYNSTRGFIFDLGETLLQKLGFPTHSVAIAVADIRQRKAQLGPEGILILTSHSQGSQIHYNAILALDPSERQGIFCLTFGGAKMIFPEDLGIDGALNFVSPYDPVPFIADPVGCVRGIVTNHPSFKLIEGQTPFKDHAFLNGPYHNELKRVADSIIERYRGHE